MSNLTIPCDAGIAYCPIIICHYLVWLFATPWTVAHQAPQSMEFSRQEHWSDLPFPSPWIFPTQVWKLGLPHCRQILQAWKWKVKVKLLSRVWLLATPWTAAYQDSPPMGFSRQEYWSGAVSEQLRKLLESEYLVILCEQTLWVI